MNKLYFGDNLDVLREYVADASVDLIYLDPPFNSQVRYNVLFKTPAEDVESAQVEAFKDTWSWTPETTVTMAAIMRGGGEIARLLDALRGVFGESDVMAYLVMMAIRLQELRRVLKPTGSIYLHCDPTAGHYLKIIMDSIFGADAFVNHITWKRSHAHSDAAQGAMHFGRVTDFILFYSRPPDRTWNVQHTPYSQEYIDSDYRRVDADGRRFRISDTSGPGGAAKGNPFYEVMGVSRHWRYSREVMDRLIAEGRVVQTRPGAVPQKKRFLDEMPGVPLQEIWADVPIINNRSKESLGYPTQKPLALLKRIVLASSNEGDVVLDPFCGCGTSIEAAERTHRQWIGIDIAIHAVKVIEARLEDDRGVAAVFKTEGMPRDFESAVRLAEVDRYQFQWWANYLFDPHALREQKKGADRGIDGELFFPNGPGRTWGRMLTSVKSGHTGPNDVRAFAHVLDREGAQMGLFICLRSPTREMIRAAAAVGLADVVHGELPKLQIVAIEEFFQGRNPPSLPPLEHLPSAAFAGRRRPAPQRPDVEQPELPFTFVSGREERGVVRHLNPAMVIAAGG